MPRGKIGKPRKSTKSELAKRLLDDAHRLTGPAQYDDATIRYFNPPVNATKAGEGVVIAKDEHSVVIDYGEMKVLKKRDASTADLLEAANAFSFFKLGHSDYGVLEALVAGGRDAFQRQYEDMTWTEIRSGKKTIVLLKLRNEKEALSYYRGAFLKNVITPLRYNDVDDFKAAMDAPRAQSTAPPLVSAEPRTATPIVPSLPAVRSASRTDTVRRTETTVVSGPVAQPALAEHGSSSKKGEVIAKTSKQAFVIHGETAEIKKIADLEKGDREASDVTDFGEKWGTSDLARIKYQSLEDFKSDYKSMHWASNHIGTQVVVALRLRNETQTLTFYRTNFLKVLVKPLGHSDLESFRTALGPSPAPSTAQRLSAGMRPNNIMCDVQSTVARAPPQTGAERSPRDPDAFRSVKIAPVTTVIDRNDLVTAQGFVLDSGKPIEIFAKKLVAGRNENDETHFVLRNGKSWITMQKKEVRALQGRGVLAFHDLSAGAKFHPEADVQFLNGYKSSKLTSKEYEILAVLVPDDGGDKASQSQMQRTVVLEFKDTEKLERFRRKLSSKDGSSAWQWEYNLPIRCTPTTLCQCSPEAKKLIEDHLQGTKGGKKYSNLPARKASFGQPAYSRAQTARKITPLSDKPLPFCDDRLSMIEENQAEMQKKLDFMAELLAVLTKQVRFGIA